MNAPFFEAPILNSPYAYPAQQWQLNEDGEPTDIRLPKRRPSKLITSVPKPTKGSSKAGQTELTLDSTGEVSDTTQVYAAETIANDIRRQVDELRKLPSAYPHRQSDREHVCTDSPPHHPVNGLPLL